MRMFLTSFVAIAATAVASAQAPLRTDRVKISEAEKLADIDLDDVKGQPYRLAWSPDGSQLYLQTLEGTFADAASGRRKVKLRHYLFAMNGGAKQNLQAQPEWVAPYWTVKSGQASPDGPPLKIELKNEERLEKTTAVPRGGDLAKGGTTTEVGSSLGDAAAAAYSSQRVFTNTLMLQGQVIGLFENSVIVPGLTFGWAPRGTKAIAFVAQNTGRVVVMDELGGMQEAPGSKDALLPAWSPEGSRLAWLQKDGRKKVVLQVARVSPM